MEDNTRDEEYEIMIYFLIANLLKILKERRARDGKIDDSKDERNELCKDEGKKKKVATKQRNSKKFFLIINIVSIITVIIGIAFIQFYVEALFVIFLGMIYVIFSLIIYSDIRKEESQVLRKEELVKRCDELINEITKVTDYQESKSDVEEQGNK